MHISCDTRSIKWGWCAHVPSGRFTRPHLQHTLANPHLLHTPWWLIESQCLHRPNTWFLRSMGCLVVIFIIISRGFIGEYTLLFSLDQIQTGLVNRLMGRTTNGFQSRVPLVLLVIEHYPCFFYHVTTPLLVCMYVSLTLTIYKLISRHANIFLYRGKSMDINWIYGE